MSRQLQLDLSLTPWQDEEDSFVPLSSKNNRIPKGIKIPSAQQLMMITGRANFNSPQPSNQNQKVLDTKNNEIKAKETNFLRKNQQELKSHSLLNTHYAAVLQRDLASFQSMGIRPPTPTLYRCSAIQTTYMGCYEQQQQPIKRKNQFSIRRQSEGRPKTTDIKQNYSTSSSIKTRKSGSKNESEKSYEGEAGGNRLQKVLKMKEKLRQKLKRNSQQKDIQRGIYSRTIMKIQQEERPRTISCQNRSLKSRQILRGQSGLPVDKWKQYIKVKDAERSHQKNNANFNVIIGQANRP